MTYDKIEEMTIIGDMVNINGLEYPISSGITDSEVKAVQYHKGHKVFEETSQGMREVSFSKYQNLVDLWIEEKEKREQEIEANKPTPIQLAKQHATGLIDFEIQKVINEYNDANGIALSSVHNAESYSRVPSYSHREFCEAVWLWSVELWEHMRAWQVNLTDIPTEEEILAKIAEKPFGA